STSFWNRRSLLRWCGLSELFHFHFLDCLSKSSTALSPVGSSSFGFGGLDGGRCAARVESNRAIGECVPRRRADSSSAAPALMGPAAVAAAAPFAVPELAKDAAPAAPAVVPATPDDAAAASRPWPTCAPVEIAF